MAHLLDTSALLAHYRQEPGSDQVQALFEREDEDLLIASVSLPEFARRLRDLGATPAAAQEIVARYRQAVTDIVSIDAPIATDSFDLLAQLPARLPLIDALIAAAARARSARLVHRDAHLRAVPAALLAQLDLESA